MATPKPSKVALKKPRRVPKSSASSRNFMERLPSEILIKILSYLDVSSLFSIGHVNKLLCRFASDNTLWYKIYMGEFGKHKKLKPEYVDVQDQALGHWKLLYFRSVGARAMNAWTKHLRNTSCHTGLPSQTERVLRNLHVTWELTVSDNSGHKATHELSWAHFSETSVTLCWSGGGCLPTHQQISSLQLHGVRRIALNCPGLKAPGWRSLMANVHMQTLTKNMQIIGEDSLVQLKMLEPGIILGLWKDQCSVAFVMFTLHFHKLVERSIQGSSVCPVTEPTVKPPFDDIDPEYGLHGYQLHLVLHDTVCELMSGTYSQLSCYRTQICDGLIQLTAICWTDLSQHMPLSGNITLPWRCEALQGRVPNCCIMNLTLLDEFKKPFWCVSSPVSMTQEKASVCYDYDGDHFLIHYGDSEGQVKMKLIRAKEQQQLFLVSLVVYVTVGKVNKHFGRHYESCSTAGGVSY